MIYHKFNYLERIPPANYQCHKSPTLYVLYKLACGHVFELLSEAHHGPIHKKQRKTAKLRGLHIRKNYGAKHLKGSRTSNKMSINNRIQDR